MWLFTKIGHLSIGQHSGEPDILLVHAQLREDIDRFVALLDAVGNQKHEVMDTTDGDYKFLVMARRIAVTRAVARMVAAIDYGKFVHSFHVDFGKKPGLQVARVNPE
jgi:hypothetical protein